MSDTIIFEDERPDIIFLYQIYDPDQDSTYNQGRVIPTVGTLVCHAPGSSIYYSVVKVENNKTTLKPIQVLATNDDPDTVSVIDYNNSRFFAFYDDRVDPTKIVIDSLLTITGSNNVEYLLKRKSPTDPEETEIISVYYDSTGNYSGNRIPLKTHIETGSKYCSNCHTLVTLEDEELITMEVYDNAGTQSAKITLFARRATILNDLDQEPIIIDFQLNSPQTKDDMIYIYEKQTPEQLLLEPTLVYNTGEQKIVPVDNERCFLYGLENLITSYPGLRQPMLCKYFLRTSEEAEGSIDDRHGRYVVVEKNIIVVSHETMFGSKISVIPLWNSLTGKYSLRFYLYTTDRDSVKDVTNKVEMLSTFDGGNFNSEQLLEFKIDLDEVFQLDDPSVHVQNLWMRLRTYASVERYILKDTENDEYAYGVDSVLYRRPVIHYDDTLEQYFIPTSIFENKEAVIESFYTRARPLFNTNTEISAPLPTHFTIRDPYTNNTITSAPIPVDEYEQAWSIVTQPYNAYINKTVIIEFLEYSGSQFHILYGVPVDVYLSTTGYNM